MPAALNFCSCQVSVKKPRASPNTCGSISTTSAIGVVANFMRLGASKFLFDDAQKIFAVAAFFERLGELHQLTGIDEPRAPGDLLHTGDLQSLPLFDDAHEHAGIEQRIVRAGIEPRR